MAALNCPECGGDGHYWQGRFGANDPEGREVICEDCGGDGTLLCDGRFCGREATQHIDGDVYCDRCATKYEEAV